MVLMEAAHARDGRGIFLLNMLWVEIADSMFVEMWRRSCLVRTVPFRDRLRIDLDLCMERLDAVQHLDHGHWLVEVTIVASSIRSGLWSKLLPGEGW